MNEIEEFFDCEMNLNLENMNLNDEEKNKLIEVMERDQKLKKTLQTDTLIQRIRTLKKEVNLLEANCLEIPSQHIKTVNFCAICKENLSYGFNYLYFSFLNQTTSCSKCKHKICQKCRNYSFDNNDSNCSYSWLCKLCHKKKELDQLLLKSGEWLKYKNSKKDPFTPSKIIEINLEPKIVKENRDQSYSNNFKSPNNDYLRRTAFRNQQSQNRNSYFEYDNSIESVGQAKSIDDLSFLSHSEENSSFSKYLEIEQKIRSESCGASFNSTDSGFFNSPPKIRLSNRLGRLKIKLEYEQKTSILNIHIDKSENLCGLDGQKYDTYIKMYLASKFDTQKRKDQTKINKQKTTIKKKDIDPIFDENFRYSIPFDELDSYKILVFVCKDHIFSKNKTLGEFEILFTQEFLTKKILEDWYLFDKTKVKKPKK